VTEAKNSLAGKTETSGLADAKALLARGDLAASLQVACDLADQGLLGSSERSQAENIKGVIFGHLGKLDAANRAFLRAACLEPAQSRYHYNLALLLERSGQPDRAVPMYRQAIGHAPNHAAARLKLAKALFGLGQESEIAAILAPLIGAATMEPEALYLSGLALLKTGAYENALNFLRRFLQHQPNHIDAILSAAAALRSLKRPKEALELLQRAHQAEPNHDEARFQFALALESAGQFEAAAPLLAFFQNDPERGPLVQSRLVRAYRHQKKYDAAIDLLKRMYARRPRDSKIIDLLADCYVLAKHREDLEKFAKEVLARDGRATIWNGLAVHLKTAGAREVAVDYWREAARRYPSIAAIAYNCGHAMNELSYAEEAEQHLRRAIAINGRYAKAWNSLGVSLAQQHRYDEAIQALWTAGQLDPNMETVWINYGIAVRALNDFTGAISAFRRALKQDRTNALAHQNLAYTLISVGEIEQGFHEYDWRWHIAEFPSTKRLYRQPVWDGRKLPDHGVVLWTEQGLGDEVMYSWYFPIVQRSVKRLIVDCDYRLISIFQRSFPGVELIPRDHDSVHPLTTESDIRFKAPAGHVPKFFFVETREAIRDTWHCAGQPYQRTQGYLKPDPERQAYWRRYLRDRFGDRLTVGISWRSAVHSRMRDMQYLEVEELARALCQDIAAVNMQYSWDSAEIGKLEVLSQQHGFQFANPPNIDLKMDLEDVFALASVVDLIISPLLSLPWMAGAVGTPCWVFRTNENTRIWQQLGTPYIPWVPSVRLFFRHPLENWDGPINRIHDDLKNLQSRFLRKNVMPHA